MPRGFYTREIIHPHFTTREYMESDQYRREIEQIQKWDDGWHRAMEKLKKTLRRTPKNP